MTALRPAMPALAAALSLLPLVSGCSLVELWNFPLGECETSMDCRALNGQEGLPPFCDAFICRPDDSGRNVCVRSDGEACDGLDNDCDGVVDEADGSQNTLDLTATQVDSDPVATVDGIDGSAGVFTDSGTARTLVSGVVRPVQLVTNAVSAGVADALGQPGTVCWKDNATSASNCTIRDLESSPILAFRDGSSEADSGSEGYYVHAFVSTQGCNAGNLRVAISAPSTPENLLMIAEPTETFRGIDTVESCSANSSIACQTAITNGIIADINTFCGLSAPDLTRLPDRNEALLTFRGTGRGDQACVDGLRTPFEVHAATLSAERGPLGPELSLANDGELLSIGLSRASRPIASTHFRNRGYLVAFANENGDIETAFVPRVEGTGRGPLVKLEEAGLPTSLTGVDDVDIAPGRDDAIRSDFSFGIAFRSGNSLAGTSCSASKQVHFLLARATPNEEFSGVTAVTFSDVVTLTDAAGDYGAPSIAWLPNLVTPDFSRNGVSAGHRVGGFVVSYRDPSGFVRVQRIAEFDGLPIDDDCATRGCSSEDLRVEANAFTVDLVSDLDGSVTAWMSLLGSGASTATLTCQE